MADDRWAGLIEAATEATTRSYAPYSGLRVGAAARLRDGSIVTGCNVENASYGLSLCAETSLIAGLHDRGFSPPTELVAVSGDGEILMPCGRCRQILHEAAGAELTVLSSDGPVRLEHLLPDAFGPRDLPPTTTAEGKDR